MPVKRKLVVVAVTAALLAGGATAALAIDGDDTTESGSRSAASVAKEIRITAEQAAAAVADRGRVIAVELDDEADRAVWEVETTTSTGEREWDVDAVTGKVTADTEEDRDDAKDDRDDRDDRDGVRDDSGKDGSDDRNDRD